MSYNSLKNLRIKYFILIASIIIISCNDQKKSTDTEKVNSMQELNQADNNEQALQVGGLYFFKNSDSSYSISKILVLDDFAVHLRTYKEKFQSKPKEINSSNLHILIGHAPLDKKGFLADNPQLLKIEEVKDVELEGYKMYLEAMSKQ